MEVSVVVPAYNEEENIERLLTNLGAVMEKLGKSYEIIVVDDGSTDRTYELLCMWHEKLSSLKIIRFRTNFGQTAAMAAGFHQAKGEIVITLDADLQNDPEDIPKLLTKADEGYDVVSGWRKKRRDPLFSRRIPSKIANRIISRITGVYLHDYGCTLKAYRKEVVKNIELYGEMHRFIPALSKWVGARVAEVEVSHYPRRFGRSKYGISRTVRVILDLITVRFLLNYSTRPIQIFGLVGLVAGFAGFLLAVFLVIQRQFFGVGLANRPMLLLAVFLIFVGVQLVSMGLLGEIQTRTYHESQGKPIYVIKEVLGDKHTSIDRSG